MIILVSLKRISLMQVVSAAYPTAGTTTSEHYSLLIRSDDHLGEFTVSI